MTEATMTDSLYRAAINCRHEIDAEKVVLYFDPSAPGHNALNQLSRRLDAFFSDVTKDAARYRAIRGIFTDILADEAGISGVAFDYQLPMALIKDASEEELLDAVADAAAEMDAEEAPK
jgi:hypothetical protein